MNARKSVVIILSFLVVSACVALGAPARKSPSVKWPGGTIVADGSINFTSSKGKLLLVCTGNVRAGAQTGGQSIALTHADKATADVDSRWQFNTIKATGDVRFAITRQSGSGTEKTSGRCNRVTIYNPAGKKPTGDERVLIADLVGDVVLTMPAPSGPDGKAAAGGSAEPMTLEGEHGQIWLKADGYEGTISGQGE